jgi:hypothetical protein
VGLPLFFALLLFTGFALAGDEKQPQDISIFSNKVEMCLHFSGEEPYDQARAREIKKNVKRYCHGLKLENAQLRRKYAKDPKTLSSLDVIEKKYKEGFPEGYE